MGGAWNKDFLGRFLQILISGEIFLEKRLSGNSFQYRILNKRPPSTSSYLRHPNLVYKNTLIGSFVCLTSTNKSASLNF